MADLDHTFGADIGPSATGDLSVVAGLTQSKQRVLRRLLTNPGSYLWHPNYGAGLASYIGGVATVQEMQALILANMLLEASVARSPAPVVTVSMEANSMAVRITYTEASTGLSTGLGFTVSP